MGSERGSEPTCAKWQFLDIGRPLNWKFFLDAGISHSRIRRRRINFTQIFSVDHMNAIQLDISARSSVFKTPWFELIGKKIGDDPALHYSISTHDYVSILAVTNSVAFPLVRQFRPAVEQVTLELPCGHVDEGETPAQAAGRELREETGFIAKELVLLGTLSPDTGRLSNKLWCFFAPGVTPARENFAPPIGIEPVIYDRPLRHLIVDEPAFSSALNRATILMAVAQGRIKLQ
jgi:ADP-ribose pyrophosphatase